MKKIAIVTPGFLPVPAVKGGAVEQLVTYILDDNEKYHCYDIDLYTINNDKLNNYKYKNTSLIQIKYNRFVIFICKIFTYILFKLHINKPFLGFCYLYLRQLNKVKYDKVIVENNMILYNYINKRYVYNTEFYYHMHNNMNEPGKTPKEATMIATTAKEVIFVSNAVKKAFNYYTNTNIGVVLHNCIDFSIYNVITSKTKKNYNYNFIFWGRICDDKGVIELINAFLRLLRKYDDITLSIVGFGFSDSLTNYEKKVLRKIVSKKIKTYSFMQSSELVKKISASDCVVIPSKYEEAFGVVALEAMAMKKAIISTNAGGLTEPLNKECAIIIDRDSLEENLYNSMEMLYKDRKLSNKLALNAYKRVKEVKEFDKENYFHGFSKIIDK